MESDRQKVVVVSNRLPVVLKKQSNAWRGRPGTGGLVSALQPVLRKRGGTWVGWPGVAGEATSGIRRALAETGAKMGVRLEPLPLTRDEIKGFYRGFSNEILWPLFHDLLAKCNFDSAYWPLYLEVNRKVSRLVARTSRAADFIWVQDYHFLQVGQELRRLGVKNRLGFFLHTPFPAPDMFLRLPWRKQILEGLLAFDLVGLQSPRDRRNFLECIESLDVAMPVDRSLDVVTLRMRDPRAVPGSGAVRVGAFPISIDFESFAALVETPRVRRSSSRLVRDLGRGRVLLGVDRLDYTKGLPQKIRGFQRALERYPDLVERVTLVQHVVPSRESVPQYKDLRLEIERLVGEVNGEFGTTSWTPVRYFYKEISRPGLAAFYRAADVLLVTSLKDGMNLVSKEYCASKGSRDGVLVLSEFAGASTELRPDALLVNPYDLDGLADAIHQAVTMTDGEKARRMAALRQIVADNDVFHWVDSFLREAGAATVEGARPPSRRRSPRAAHLDDTVASA